MSTSDFTQLRVWQTAMDFTVKLYETSKSLPKEEIYALSNQMRRAAVSIPSNIAEGQSRNGEKEFIHFLAIARGSVAELKTQLMICEKLSYISTDEVDQLMGQLIDIDKMLSGLINSIYKKFK